MSGSKRIIGADRDEVLADLDQPVKYRSKTPGSTYRERWQSQVDSRGPDDCWLWQGATTQNGYGVSHIYGYQVCPLAHHIAYVVHHGGMSEGLEVIHSCDTPTCCNPGHLSLGTRKDNMQDMILKGRSNKKGKPGRLFTDDEVREMRRRRVSGERINRIAQSLGKDRTAVGAAIRGVTYKHVAMEESTT